MSQLPQSVSQALRSAQQRFEHLARETGASWQRESLFAMQALRASNYLLNTANKKPESLRMAVLNVAQMGLTLNPAYQHSFLVPRDGEVKLDISYRGLIHLGVREGAIKWSKAEVVYAEDHFEWCGLMTPPVHRFDPFSDRGAPLGVYVVTKMPDGEYLCDHMPEAQIERARMMSAAYNGANGPSGPWTTWDDEMRKKVGIKRAQKTWPRARTESVLDQAVYQLNHELGEAGTEPEATDPSAASGAGEVVPADHEIDDHVRQWVDRTIERARAAEAWTAARSYLQERFSGANLVWALDRLSQAQSGGRAA